MKDLQKIIIVYGPTASGKSDIAVDLALKLNGEVISADSRQVYKGLDIGTGKITKEEMRGVPHHLLDVADPQERFDVVDWKNLAEKAIEDISSRGKVPIICGGTGFYIHSLINNIEYPDIQIDENEKNALESKNVDNIYAELEKIDPNRAESMKTGGDFKNKRRVIRALMIAKKLGRVPSIKVAPCYDIYFYETKFPDSVLKERIRARLLKRIEIGMIDEGKRLHEQGLSYERFRELGLEYKYLADLLENKMSMTDFIETLNSKIWQYARRQKTWFKKAMSNVGRPVSDYQARPR